MLFYPGALRIADNSATKKTRRGSKLATLMPTQICCADAGGVRSQVTQVSAEHFQDADRYTAYLRTIEGRLRTDLAWSNVREFLRDVGPHRRALDAGGGSGVFAVRLASLGFDVELLDNSEAMLAAANKEAEANAPRGRISFHCGNVHRAADLFEPASFDLVVCHNLLEYTEGPLSVLRGLVQLLRKDNTSLLSLLLSNRCGEVLKAAVKTRDLELAKAALTANTVLDSLYGRPVRVFDPAEVRVMAAEAGLQVICQRGVRVVADYLDCEALTVDAYRRLLDFERLLGENPQLSAAARYTQVIASVPPTQSSEAK
jgi:S-adenosylmethionine-dependent methyltransferase